MASPCKWTARDVNREADQVTKNYSRHQKSLPDLLPIANPIQFSWNGNDNVVDADFEYESIVRPKHDQFFVIPFFPLLGASVERKRNALYICAEGTEDITTQKITVLFLDGHGLDPNTGNPSLRIAPVKIKSVIGEKSDNIIDNTFGRIPIVGKIITFPGNVLDELRNRIRNAIGVIGGVEGMTLTSEGLYLLSRVTSDHPGRYFIPFPKEKP
jgi:hypothetical protein